MESIDYKAILEQIQKEHPFYKNTDIAYEFILERILAGDFRPGYKLLQESLSQNLDMSRTPVRDALIRLEEEGFLKKNGNQGYQVCTIGLRDYIDFCEFRLIIEPKAAFWAARNITSEQMKRLEANMQAFRELEPENTARRSILDNEFHSIIGEASGNLYIQKTMEQYAGKRTFNNQVLLQPDRYVAALNKHELIFKAICEGNEKAAEEEMESHLRYYIRNVSLYFSKLEEYSYAQI